MMAGAAHDLAIVGAGPVGCAAALACAREGKRVLLLEQEPWAAADRVVGEWLHPPAMDVLEGLGVDLEPPVGYPTGKGFVVFPDDGSEPIVLPYARGRFGFSLEHGLLVETLRAHAERHPRVDYVPFGRALRVEGDVLAYDRRGRTGTARIGAVAAASGAGTQVVARGDVIGFADSDRPPTHRIAGVTLLGVELPFEGYHHLFVGGPGPVVAYRVGPSRVRLLLDVPLTLGAPRQGGPALHDAYAPALPRALGRALADTLARTPPTWSHGYLRPRGDVAKGGVCRLGDAVGSVHPLTAADLTLGLGDALALATAGSPRAYRGARRRAARIPETVALGLAELFTDPAPEIVAIRRATYRTWRAHPRERLRSMGFVAGEGDGHGGDRKALDLSTIGFGGSCLRVAVSSAADVWRGGARSGQLTHAGSVSVDLVRRMGWMLGGSLGWTDLLPDVIGERLEERRGAAARYGSALATTAGGGAEVVGLPAVAPTSVEEALRRGVAALIDEQAEDGSFEGERTHGPLVAAQYVLACHAMDRPIGAERRRLLLRHFEETRLPNGAWGLHPKAEPSRAVSALVYAAARLLGPSKDDPLIAGGRAYLRATGGAVGVPSGAALWLALVGLYDWDGVSPISPALFAAPRWLPIHPSRYAPHARMAYLGMATLFGERVQRAPTPVVRAIADELFVTPFAEVDFRAARAAHVAAPATGAFRLGFQGLRVLDALKLEDTTGGVIAQLRERIRYELRSTSHASLSPSSALLGLLALHAADPEDLDVAEGLARFEGWIWEDEERGARVCGTRSATWDTALATQALAAASPFVDVRAPLERADAFLATQQIAQGTGREADNDRVDPSGGWCVAGAWHGWPSSDATAEALLARLAAPHGRAGVGALTEAVRFLLRTQHEDGDFGRYEPRRLELPLDLLDPSEAFGGARLRERPEVELTASAIAALAAFRQRFPDRLRSDVDRAIARGVAALRRAQRPDGSFEGHAGVCFIYGTLFGVRGLLAAGVPSVDPQIRLACAFLLERQRPDGGWGEHFSSVREGRFIAHEDGHAVQTAWALTALLEAREPDFAALERAARFLAKAQAPDGTWPHQFAEGISLERAPVDHELYRRAFPPWALGLYQRRAAERTSADRGDRTPRSAVTPH